MAVRLRNEVMGGYDGLGTVEEEEEEAEGNIVENVEVEVGIVSIFTGRILSVLPVVVAADIK